VNKIHHGTLMNLSKRLNSKEDLPTKTFYTFLLSVPAKPHLPLDVLRHVLEYCVESYSRAMLRLLRRMRKHAMHGRILFCQKTDDWRLQIEFFTHTACSTMVDIEIEADDGYWVSRYDSMYFHRRGYQDDGVLANLFSILCEKIEERYDGDTDMF
jgi:hypothetical protein